MRGSSLWTGEAEPYSHSTQELIQMGQINPSPLAVSSERAPGRRHPECDRCPLQADCREAVIALQPFVRPECNTYLGPSLPPRRKRDAAADVAALYDYIGAHPGSSTSNIAAEMHLGYITTVRILAQLCADGQVYCTITQRERKHCYYLGS